MIVGYRSELAHVWQRVEEIELALLIATGKVDPDSELQPHGSRRAITRTCRASQIVGLLPANELSEIVASKLRACLLHRESIDEGIELLDCMARWSLDGQDELASKLFFARGLLRERSGDLAGAENDYALVLASTDSANETARLLAGNNLGNLHIKSGRFSGVPMICRAAFNRLPAASFTLWHLLVATGPRDRLKVNQVLRRELLQVFRHETAFRYWTGRCRASAAAEQGRKGRWRYRFEVLAQRLLERAQLISQDDYELPLWNARDYLVATAGCNAPVRAQHRAFTLYTTVVFAEDLPDTFGRFPTGALELTSTETGGESKAAADQTARQVAEESSQ